MADSPGRTLRRLAPLWLLAPVVLLLYLWTWTETVVVTLLVSDGRCTAVAYGRSSAVDCPGLVGGRAATALNVGATGPARSPLERLMPPARWTEVEITSGGRTVSLSGPLPTTFELTATLRRPTEAAAVMLLPPDGEGWAFVVEADNRRGAWWRWADGPAAPLRGIPLDRPPAEQAKPFLRQLLAGYPAAAALAALVALLGRRPTADRRQTTDDGRRTTNNQRRTTNDEQRTTNDQRPTANDHSPLVTRAASEDADSAVRHSPPATRRRPLVARHSSLVACFIAFALALHVSVTVLERIPHVQDSVTYLFQAQTLARGALTAPAPPLAAAEATAHFDQEFLLVRDGRWFGKYPPGWPALLALGVLLDAPWLVNPLLAALTVALIYQLGCWFGAQGSGGAGEQGRSAPATGHWPLTTVLLTTSPFFLIMSGSLMAHSAELFWTVLFMVAWSRVMGGGLPTRPTRRWAVVAGLALGALFLTRQFTALTIGLAFGGGLLLMRSRRWFAPQGSRGAGVQGEDAHATRHPPLATDLLTTDLMKTILLPALLASAPLLLALPLYQLTVTDTRADPRLLYWPYDRAGFGPGVGEPENAFTMTMTSAGPAITWYTDPDQPPRGHSPARGLYNLGRNLDALLSDLFGWPPALTLAFVWLAFLLRRPSVGDWVLLLTLLAVAGGYLAYWSAGVAYGPRYFYAALPALVILTARGATALATYVHSRGASEDAHSASDNQAGGREWRADLTGLRRPVRSGAGDGQWAVVVILLLLLGYNLIRLPGRIDSYRGYNFVSAEGRRAVEAAVETPALVFVAAGAADWWEYGAFFSGNTPWLDGPVVYARDLGQSENARLRALFPDRRAYRWVDSHLLLEE